MNAWFAVSRFGAVFVVLYLAVAVWIVREDRQSPGGGWISLNGMASYLITLPVSVIGEKLGARPDYRRNVDMIFAIGVCTVLLYFMGAGLGKLAHFIFTGARSE
jgi:hypothetical protein